jgi:phage terminase Nu1 subunit (DNA packaging protein)
MTRLTQTAFGDHIGVDRSAVCRLVKAGTINLVDGLEACRLAYISQIREQAAGRLSTGDYDLTTERARLANHQADEKELHVKILKGDLVPSEQVLKMLETVIGNARAKLLNLPVRAAQVALAATDIHDIEREIKSLVYEALDELAAGS